MFMTFLAIIAAVFAVTYYFGRNRAIVVVDGQTASLHSRPTFHGGYLALMTCVPAFLLLIIWSFSAHVVMDRIVISASAEAIATLSTPEVEAFIRDARAIAFGGIVGFTSDAKQQGAELYLTLDHYATAGLSLAMAGLMLAGFVRGYRQITAAKRSRHFVERAVMVALVACSVVAILTTIGIVLSLIFESIQFFRQVPFFDFLFGLHWSPQTAIRADQVGAEGSFGAVPLFVGTLLITLIAIFVAAPIGLMSAIYLSDYATPRVRATVKPLLEILAGVPTVVYGFFAALTVAPFFRGLGEAVGLGVSSESALAAGIVMGIMIIPFISSLSDDVINAVPQTLRDGSAALGATKSETVRNVVLPAALPGIVSALILAISRAIGETMIVVMAAGLAANLTVNPLEAVTTVTVQIVTLLVGDQEFDSAKTLAAFALGLVLFCITLCLNVIALRVVQKYREQYD